MKNKLFSKCVYGVVVGLFVPLSAVHALDANDRIQMQLGGEGNPVFTGSTMAGYAGKPESWLTQQGAQGPMRSDLTENKATEHELAAKRMNAEKRLFPLNADGG